MMLVAATELFVATGKGDGMRIDLSGEEFATNQARMRRARQNNWRDEKLAPDLCKSGRIDVAEGARKLAGRVAPH